MSAHRWAFLRWSAPHWALVMVVLKGLVVVQGLMVQRLVVVMQGLVLVRVVVAVASPILPAIWVEKSNASSLAVTKQAEKGDPND